MSIKRGDKRAIIIGAIIVLVASFGAVTYKLSAKAEIPVIAPAVTVQLADPPTAARLFELVNAERAKVGVAPLIEDKNMDISAFMKADDMYTRNYFSHIIKGTNVVSTDEMLELTYTNCVDNSASENIRDNDEYINTAEEAVTAWVQSAPHYKAMVNPEYTLTGIGVAGDKIVQRFCIAK